ncbi:nucleotide sugar dehydrogenase [Spirillospora sp. NPDC127200]
MQFLPASGKPRVAVLGMGHVGSCLAATLADLGTEVVGIDTDAALVEEVRRGRSPISEPGLAEMLAGAVAAGRLHCTTDYQEVRRTDVVIITVGTPVGPGGVLIEGQLEALCTELAGHLRPGQLVLLKSTVPPGAARRLVVPLLERCGLQGGTDFGFAFCPERLSEGSALRELRAIPIVVGGWNAESTEAAASFWRQAFGAEVIVCTSMEVAEITKLADNWWIDLNIAMANELARVCAVFDADVLEVIKAANTVPKGGGRVNILLPSVGVGGSCLTKDPWMVWRAARDHGVELRTVTAAREINDAMPRYTFDLIVDGLRKLGKDPASATVAVLGLAYKNDTGDLRDTPVRTVVEALRSAGVRVAAYDPLVDPDRAERELGVRPAGTLEAAVRGADCLAVLAKHREFADIDFAGLRPGLRMPCLVLDGRAYYPQETIARLRGLGFAYRGIGR